MADDLESPRCIGVHSAQAANNKSRTLCSMIRIPWFLPQYVSHSRCLVESRQADHALLAVSSYCSLWGLRDAGLLWEIMLAKPQLRVLLYHTQKYAIFVPRVGARYGSRE